MSLMTIVMMIIGFLMHLGKLQNFVQNLEELADLVTEQPIFVITLKSSIKKNEFSEYVRSLKFDNVTSYQKYKLNFAY